MSVNINGQDFKVLLTTEPIGGEDGRRFFIGSSDESDNIIIIDGTLPKTRQNEVLMHEFIHLADGGMPEFLVADLSKALFGILSQNGLISSSFLSKVSDGDVSKADMAKINELSNEMVEKTEQGLFPLMIDKAMAVSTQAFYGKAISDDGNLQVFQTDGALNSTAVHKATSQLCYGAELDVSLTLSDRKRLARELVTLYRENLKDPVPEGLAVLARL